MGLDSDAAPTPILYCMALNNTPIWSLSLATQSLWFYIHFALDEYTLICQEFFGGWARDNRKHVTFPIAWNCLWDFWGTATHQRMAGLFRFGCCSRQWGWQRLRYHNRRRPMIDHEAGLYIYKFCQIMPSLTIYMKFCCAKSACLLIPTLHMLEEFRSPNILDTQHDSDLACLFSSVFTPFASVF